jgi:hypothetical protein
MRDDAARALRVDDDLPLDDDYAALRARATERRFERTARPRASAALALADPPFTPVSAAAEPVRETVSLPRTAPGRSYGAHRRGDFAPSRIAGPQPGRRTIEITGQSPAPRRRSQTTAAFAARPDRAALWAFWLALFLIVMAVATAHG